MFKFGYHSIQSMEGVSHKSKLAENAGLQSREFLARVKRKGFRYSRERVQGCFEYASNTSNYLLGLERPFLVGYHPFWLF